MGVVWIGDPPDEISTDDLSDEFRNALLVNGKYILRDTLQENVFDKTLRCGIRAYGWRDGLFGMDFSGWRSPESDDFDELERLQATYARVLNVHLLCLQTAQLESNLTPYPVRRVNPHEMYGTNPDRTRGGGGSRGFPPAVIPMGGIPPHLMFSGSWVSNTTLTTVEVLAASCDLLDSVIAHSDARALPAAALLHEATVKIRRAFRDHRGRIPLRSMAPRS